MVPGTRAVRYLCLLPCSAAFACSEPCAALSEASCSFFGPRACTFEAVRVVPHCLPLTLTLSPAFGPVSVPRPDQETRVSAPTATVTAVPAEPFAASLPFLTVTEKEVAETDASVPERWNRRQSGFVPVGAAAVVVVPVPVVVEPPGLSSARAKDAPAPATASARKSALSFMGRASWAVADRRVPYRQERRRGRGKPLPRPRKTTRSSECYLISTDAPASSSWALIVSASSWATPSLTA